MSARFLDDDARAAFKRAIEAIESASAAEVVVAVRRRSDPYRHANVAVGAAVAFAGLAVMLFSAHPFGLTSILVDPFAAGLIAGALVELLPGVKRRLTPPAHRRAHVRRAARATFVERGVHNTAGRTGVLIYISWLEQHVAVIADSAAARGLPDDCEPTLVAAMPRGGAAVAAALEQLAPALARTLPRSADDVNELPDAIDSDLGPA